MRRLSIPTQAVALPGSPPSAGRLTAPAMQAEVSQRRGPGARRLTVIRTSGGGILPDALVITDEPFAAETSLPAEPPSPAQPAAQPPKLGPRVSMPPVWPASPTGPQARLSRAVRRGSLPGHLWHHRQSSSRWRHHRRTRSLQTPARL
jgi:hypothetical protein